MARKQVPVKAISAIAAFVAGEAMNVSAVCRECGIAPKTFYKYVARYRVEGLAGFEERSRRPHTSPTRTCAGVEDEIVRLRKQLADEGLDHGAVTIQWHLGRDRRFKRAVPSQATIHRVLVRRGFVVAQPQKRPKRSWCRFEADASNELWQIDATEWTIATGVVKIFNIIDDHSRVVCSSRVVHEATTQQAWVTFCEAATRWGFPAAALSDNGLCFSGKLHGCEVLFEANLRDAGIQPITGRPYHPQTTGKVERFQQTLKKWLRQQDRNHRLARDLDELQARLERFCDHYNHHRPHQGIGRATPISRWRASTPATAADAPLEHPAPRPHNHTVVVDTRGAIAMHDFSIGVGARWAGCTVTVIVDEHHATVLCGTQLVRHLRIDRTRYYQPLQRPPGGPRQPRQLSS